MAHHNSFAAHHHLSAADASQAVIESNYVKVIGEDLGIPSLSEECSSLIAAHVTWRLKVIMESAKKMAVHGRRARLSVEDIDWALTRDADQKMLALGHGGGEGEPASYRLVPGSVETLGHEVFIADDSDVEVNTVVNRTNLKPSHGVAMIAHWLVVDGQQPALPQNPRSRAKEPETELSVEENDTGASASLKESQDELGVASSFRSSFRWVRKSERVQLRQSLSHNLSMEQQLFFKEIMEACVGLDDKKRVEALQSLQVETGLNALLPNISRWLAQGVRHNIIHRSLAMLIYIVRAYSSLVHNKSLDLTPVLHEMIPSLLSCMMSRHLCGRPEVDNHWTLRDYASKCLLQLIREHGVCDTKERVRSVLLRVFTDTNSSFSMLYGAFFALYDLSSSVERASLHGHFVSTLRRVRTSTTAPLPSAQAIEADKLYALLNKFEPNMSKCASLHQRNNNVTKAIEDRAF